jgi:hypothetical protein
MKPAGTALQAINPSYSGGGAMQISKNVRYQSGFLARVPTAFETQNEEMQLWQVHQVGGGGQPPLALLCRSTNQPSTVELRVVGDTRPSPVTLPFQSQIVQEIGPSPIADGTFHLWVIDFILDETGTTGLVIVQVDGQTVYDSTSEGPIQVGYSQNNFVPDYGVYVPNGASVKVFEDFDKMWFKRVV